MKPQARRVLTMLEEAERAGVTNGQFVEMGILNYKGRVCELRKEGYDILTRYHNTRRQGTVSFILIGKLQPAGHQTTMACAT